MHLLTTSSTGLDEIVEAVDLGQPPGDIAILSFADSDLAGLAAAWEAERENPAERAAGALTRSASSDVGRSVDRSRRRPCQGDPDSPSRRIGLVEIRHRPAAALARERGIVLAVLPGEDRDDMRLEAASTLPPDELAALLQYFREGGRANMRALLDRLARYAGCDVVLREPKTVPRLAGYLPGEGAVAVDRLVRRLRPASP